MHLYYSKNAQLQNDRCNFRSLKLETNCGKCSTKMPKFGCKIKKLEVLRSKFLKRRKPALL